jgi:hypothetical protein
VPPGSLIRVGDFSHKVSLTNSRTKYFNSILKFVVLMTINVKIMVFLDVKPQIPGERYQYLDGICHST